MSIADRINELARQANPDAEQVARAIAELISGLNVSEQLELHSHLSEQALALITAYRNKLNLSYQVQEHLIWWYFKMKDQPANNHMEADLFHDLLGEYASTKSIGLVPYQF